MKRFDASAWWVLALFVTVEVTGCDGESSTGDDTGGSGASSGGAGAGKGGTSGSSGVGGAPGGSPTGGSSAGGKGGAATGGVGAVGGGSGEAGAGASGGEAGEGQGGTGQAGEGGGGPDDTTVSGRVVDFWRRPLANVPVTIGTTTVPTNGQGEFSIPAVAPEYDASLVVTWPGGQAGVYGWRFEGLTRRDPTLQVYKGREARYGDIVIDPQGETLNASRTLFVALAGVDGSATFEGVGGSGRITSTTWYGSETMQASLHALLWELDSNELPTVYRSYDSASATFDSTTTTDTTVTFNLADETIASGTVSGTVTTPSSTERQNYAFVRFADNAAIRTVSQFTTAGTFSYVLPALPSSSVIIAASYGNSAFGEYAVAHRDGLAPGQSGVVITIPAVMTQVVPTGGITGVNASTQFSWSGAAGPCVFHAEDVNYYEGLYVVTSRHTITLPTFPSFTPRRGALYNWRIERHGSASTVDALAVPDGYLDSFSRSGDDAEGPKTGDGSYTISTGRTFTTAP